MTTEETKIEGCFIIEPQVYSDKRGYFFESFNNAFFEKTIGKTINFVQDNESFSTKGVLRGLHYQTGENAQAKLVRVIQGRILDVAVDLRPNAKTFGQHVSVELSSENKLQMFIPRGFAHGFVVLSNTAVFAYKCDNFYNKKSEQGIIYSDKTLNIDWQLKPSDLILSEKDLLLPSFENAVL